MIKKTCDTIVPQSPAESLHCKACNSTEFATKECSDTTIAQQLHLWESPQKKPEELDFYKRPKPKISSIPGISPKQRDRYRVVFGDEILGERLTVDEALKLLKGGECNV